MEKKLDLILSLLRELRDTKDNSKVIKLEEKLNNHALEVKKIINNNYISENVDDLNLKLKELDNLINDLNKKNQKRNKIFLDFNKYLKDRKIN